MKFIIEKGVPVPARPTLSTDMRETLKALQPDESFLILFNKIRPEDSIRCTFYQVRKEFPDRIFVSAKEEASSGIFGLRIWRVPLPQTKPTTKP
jgi:hypothetical protein